MNRKFVLALMLASGMAFAQTGGAGSTPDQQQQPSQQPPSPSTSPTTPDQSQTATAPGDQQASMKGCLKQSGGNWVLAADNGQSVNLQGDSSMLKPHDGHQVQIQGTRASDGSVQVTSVSMISDSCTSNQAATSTETGAAGAVSGAATGAAAAGAQAADKTAEAAKSTADTAAAQATQPSTQTTPDQGQQPAATTPPGAAAPDQTAAPTAAPEKPAAGTGEQTAAPAEQGAKAGQKLPQTASPLPLLGLLGFGSLAAGLISRKKK